MRIQHKRIIIYIASIVFILLVVGAVLLFVPRNKSATAPTSPSTSTDQGGTTIPATKDAQNKAAQNALDAALTALNAGDKTESKKQLDIAKKLFQAAGNQEGIDNVEGLYPVADAIPETSPTPTGESTTSEK